MSDFTREEMSKAVSLYKRVGLSGMSQYQREAYREYFRLDRAARRNPNLPRVYKALKEDGIIDEVAIDIAVKGERVVALTIREREIAIRRMRGMGMTKERIGLHIGMQPSSIKHLNRIMNKAAAA